MPDLSPVQHADLLDWIGQVEPGEDPDAVLQVRGTVERTALSILRRRRAVLGPQKWSLSGDYSQDDAGATVAWLDGQIARLEELTGESDGSGLRTGRVVRRQPGR